MDVDEGSSSRDTIGDQSVSQHSRRHKGNFALRTISLMTALLISIVRKNFHVVSLWTYIRSFILSFNLRADFKMVSTNRSASFSNNNFLETAAKCWRIMISLPFFFFYYFLW